jgi:urease accessory protein
MTILIDSLPQNFEKKCADDFVELSWIERSRPRIRCRSLAGVELALALPRGTILQDNDLLINNNEHRISVRAKLEPVLVIAPANEAQLCLIAHHLGNWHRAMQFQNSHCLVTEPDGVLEEWLRKMQFSHTIEHLPYHPNMREIEHKISISI